MARTTDLGISDADRSVLGPLAEHRFLTVPQVALLIGVGAEVAEARLEHLRVAGLVAVRRIFDGVPPAVAVTARGLRASGSTLKTAPRINYNHYAHEVGVGWLWLAARAGRFGELERLTVERPMRSQDYAARLSGGPPPWGIGLGMLGPYGGRRYHYPDLMLETRGGHRVAIELELSGKSARQLAPIMRAYASDARIDHVLYLVGAHGVARAITNAASLAGIAERVHVNVLAPGGIAGAEIRELGASGSRQRQAVGRRAPARAAETGGAQR